MNKRERWLKGNFKFKKRIKSLGLNLDEFSHNCYRTTGKPCSCPMCSPGKLGEKKKYKVKHKKVMLENDI